ncbi:carbohydrate ABC transporter permease [Promicromonospora sukumoe]|uniref:carbohydrate ABC transporter permease n=1 Tax=Promicromonospora sukumoe TaxID=88382 RepID=UPI00037195DF|nr:carbohydrate ABC transporter permease [Promicromonospora sukumoe]
MNDSRAQSISRWLLTALLAIGSLTIAIPLYFTVVTALKSPSELRGNLWAPPQDPAWSNFSDAIETTGFFQALGNSLLVTVLSIVLVVVTNSLVGYAIARNLHKRLYRGLFVYFLTALFIPFPIVMLPLVKEMAFLGLGNLTGLVIVYVVYNLSFNVLLYVGYMSTVPVSLEEAAMLDGAGPFATFRHVIFPLLTPVNATVAILTGLWVWNDFMLPLVLLSDQAQFTLPLVQNVFQGRFTTQYNLAFSSYILALTPMVLIYLVFQRWIIGGVMHGAIK